MRFVGIAQYASCVSILTQIALQYELRLQNLITRIRKYTEWTQPLQLCTHSFIHLELVWKASQGEIFDFRFLCKYRKYLPPVTAHKMGIF